jgi:hypothetical protein
MKDPTKNLYRWILGSLIALLILMIPALWTSGQMESLESLAGTMLSSLVNSETVYILLFVCAAVMLCGLLLLIFVFLLSKPLFQKWQKEYREKRRLSKSQSRFSGLKQMDEQLNKAPKPDYDDPELAQICVDFRNFAASKLGLYYDMADIRRFIAGLGISRLLILRGMSGTGKTSLAYAAGEYFGNSSTIVPIQPMWKERSDILGYFNEFTKRFNESKLLSKLYEAGGTDHVYITVLDEVNIARIEYYFAEFLSLLEIPDPEKRLIDVVADSWPSDPARIVGGKLLLPENMWFIGTANNDDSTFSISDKVYDRSMILDLERKCQSFDAPETPASCLSYQHLRARFDAAKASGQLSQQGRAALSQLDDHLTDVFRISFGNRIMRQVEEYVPVMIACGGTELDALDDILSRKIFRKLEQVSPVMLRSQIPQLMQLLEELFGKAAMPQSEEYLNRLLNNV